MYFTRTRDVLLRGVVGDAEPLGDRFQGQSGGVQAEHLALTVGQLRVGERAVAVDRVRPLEVLERLPLAIVRSPRRRRRCGGLADDACGSRGERLAHGRGSIGDAVDEHRRALADERVDVLGDGRAVAEGQIEDDDVGGRSTHRAAPGEVGAHRRARVDDDLDACPRARGLEPQTHGLVVIDECDAGHAPSLTSGGAGRAQHGDGLHVVRMREEVEGVDARGLVAEPRNVPRSRARATGSHAT
jgi:hypothetical protein